jgi:hypothetical protein
MMSHRKRKGNLSVKGILSHLKRGFRVYTIFDYDKRK